MFDFFKRKEECTEMVQQPEENLLREYISVDSVKAHLVDILEENRKLKAQIKDITERKKETETQNRKEREIAIIEADEYKKRDAEAKKEVTQKESATDRLNDQIEKLRKERNTLITAADMAEDRLRKEEQRMKEKEDCSAWLRSKLEEYGNWERVTKTELIGIIRTAIEK